LKIFEIGLLICATVPIGLRAQQFNVGGHPVQYHAFASQGFAYSDVNNYLTMPTSDAASPSPMAG
jgi:hypothetical protein